MENNPYLGIVFDNKLKWSTHIDNLSKKASSSLGFVMRNLKKCPTECKKAAYISLVRSTLEYGAVIWDPPLEKDIYKLEKINRKAARFIKGDFKTRKQGCVAEMLNELKLPTLESRRKEKRLTFLYNIQTGKVPAIDKDIYLNPIKQKRRIKAKTFSDCVTDNILTRHQNLNSKCFNLPKSNSNTYKHSFFPKTIAEWNELPEDIVTAPSATVFKNRLCRLNFESMCHLITC